LTAPQGGAGWLQGEGKPVGSPARGPPIARQSLDHITSRSARHGGAPSWGFRGVTLQAPMRQTETGRMCRRIALCLHQHKQLEWMGPSGTLRRLDIAARPCCSSHVTEVLAGSLGREPVQVSERHILSRCAAQTMRWSACNGSDRLQRRDAVQRNNPENSTFCRRQRLSAGGRARPRDKAGHSGLGNEWRNRN
jgi:hypothetical protein